LPLGTPDSTQVLNGDVQGALGGHQIWEPCARLQVLAVEVGEDCAVCELDVRPPVQQGVLVHRHAL
jgi:hypothetical protein